MKNKILIKAIYVMLVVTGANYNMAFSQGSNGNKNIYSTTGGEIIFSWADVTKDGFDATVVTRFSPVFNFQYQLNKDVSEHFGFLTGFNIRNVGFIYNDPTTVNTRYKERSYTFGIPIAIKAGNMNGYYFFGGYEIEFPFNFKEKKFVNEDKVDKVSSWFSSKTPSIYQSLFAGFQTPFGTQLKFKYYMTNFLNKNYSANDGSGNIVYPYKNMDANVFYVSLSFQILKGSHYYYIEK